MQQDSNDSRKSRVVGSPSADFNLHSLGWKSFQDLCATILQTVLNRPVQTFAATHDEGRDATFRGEPPNALTVVQCKSTSIADSLISLSDLKDEIGKAARLAANGLADSYILMTNARCTAKSEARIRVEFLSIAGINDFSIYGADWINLQIAQDKRLRALVPRLYGLGDLSQILDERDYDQALEILTSMGPDLSKLVVTQAQQKAAEALIDEGFVLLLGDPATGKSTIAAGLSVAAIDLWRARPLKLTSPEEFKDHWNPHEPEQLFWFDDAFGTTQYQLSVADHWNRIIPHMRAALTKGARVLLTSRTYIYQRAVLDLKIDAFPLFRDSQVVIQVRNLSLAEKSQILYNHIKLGGQSKTYKKQIQPFLRGVAENKWFLPETARRLGNPALTQNLQFTQAAVRHYVENPLPMLLEIIQTADSHTRAALAIVFMSGNRLPSPIELTDASKNAIKRLGSNESSVYVAMEALKNSLVKLVTADGSKYWAFQHPTVRDAFAIFVANSAELVDIYIAGTPIDQLVEEVVCGAVSILGAKVSVPRHRYDSVVERLGTLNTEKVASFLMTRCDRSFNERFLQAYPDFFAKLWPPNAYAIYLPLGKLVVHLAALDLLPEDVRTAFVKNFEATIEAGDLEPMADEMITQVLTDDERSDIRGFIRSEYFNRFDEYIDLFEANWDSGTNPEEHYSSLYRSLEVVEEMGFADPKVTKEIDSARAMIDDKIAELEDQFNPGDDSDQYYGDDIGGGSIEPAVDDSIFSDIAE